MAGKKPVSKGGLPQQKASNVKGKADVGSKSTARKGGKGC